MNFSGYHPYTMDAKGRVAVPARFRDQMSPEDASELRLTLSVSNPQHLKLYPRTAWATLQERIESIDNAHQRQAFRRHIVGGAHLVGFDVQGRILVPPQLREKAGLAGDVVIVGEGDHVQFWAPAAWDAAYGEALAVMRDSGALLAELGF